MQRRADFHEQVADTGLPEAAGVVDDATTLDAAVHVLDAHAATSDASIRRFLPPRELPSSRLPGRHDALHLVERECQKPEIVDDILVKVDRMSMANSLEVRTPYLDYRVVEFAAALPSQLKRHGLQTKYLLKRCMAPKLPEAILKRRQEGFSIPMKNWLKQELRPLMHDMLSPERLKREGLFNPSYVEALQAEHLLGKANHSHRLWALMIFEIWQRYRAAYTTC